MFELREGVFEEMGRYDAEDDTLISPTLSGFGIELAEVFSS